MPLSHQDWLDERRTRVFSVPVSALWRSFREYRKERSLVRIHRRLKRRSEKLGRFTKRGGGGA